MNRGRGDKADLDNGWIEEGLNKRRACASAVVCFETGDPGRREQLLDYLPWVEDFRQARFFRLQPWRGLERLDRQRGGGSP